MLTIGEFSKVCFVTKKTLRYYDEIGLLKPEHIAESGYRYYTSAQLRTMRMITRLKGYGCSLPEIAAVLAKEDSDHLMAVLDQRRQQLLGDIHRQEYLLTQLERDMDKLKRRVDLMKSNLTIKVKDRQPVGIFSIRRNMAIAEFDQGYGELFARAGQCGAQITGVPYAIYHDQEFNHDCSDIELAMTAQGQGEGFRELPGGPHAYATHVGPFNEEYSSIFSQIVEWIEENGYEMAGPPFDEYVKSHGNGADSPEDFITQVYFPVRKK